MMIIWRLAVYSERSDNFILHYKNLEVLDSLDIGTENLAFLNSFICTLFVEVESFVIISVISRVWSLLAILLHSVRPRKTCATHGQVIFSFFFYFIALELANDDATNSLLINSENESYRGNGLYCTFLCMINQIRLDSQWHNWRNNPTQITIITGICPLFLWSWIWAPRWRPICRVFVESWRSVPKWYTYRHDVLLMELVMRHGIDCDAIEADLYGEKLRTYRSRLKCDDRTVKEVRDHPFWSFCSWCATRVNLLHRLKYLTNAIVEVLQGETYSPSLVQIRSKEYRYGDMSNLDRMRAINASWNLSNCGKWIMRGIRNILKVLYFFICVHLSLLAHYHTMNSNQVWAESVPGFSQIRTVEQRVWE